MAPYGKAKTVTRKYCYDTVEQSKLGLMNYAPKRVKREVQPSHVEPEPPRRKPSSWSSEMLYLLREYRQADKDYKASMRALETRVRALETRVKEMGRRGYND